VTRGEVTRCEEVCAAEGTPPPVFFVRAADKGLMVDGASRASRFVEMNGEAQGSEMGAEAIKPGSFAALRMTDLAQGPALGGWSVRPSSVQAG
jgi:hypothetical protein